MITAINGWIKLHADFGTVYNGSLNGIPYNTMSGTQPIVPVVLDHYAAESDRLPVPIPAGANIEGDSPTGPRADNHGDRHLIVYDQDNNIVYELFGAYRPGETRQAGQVDPINWHANSEAVWDLNTSGARPTGWTSVDAAGLPIMPGLARLAEVFDQGEIDHALRFTVRQTADAFVFPASHEAGTAGSINNPRMGERFRLKPGEIPAYTDPVYLQQDVIILKAQTPKSSS